MGALPCLARGETTEDCQTVGLAFWAQPLGGSFYKLTNYFYLILLPGSWEWRPNSWATLRWLRALPSKLFLSPWVLLWSSSSSQFPCPHGNLLQSHLAYAFCKQKTCAHFSPRAGADAARMDQWKAYEALSPTQHPQHKARILLYSSSFCFFSSLSSHQASREDG
jgi:hypothetical protein